MGEEILSLFGLTFEDFALVSGIVLGVVEYAKRQWPKNIKGKVTIILSFLISFGVSCKLYLPDWEKTVAMSLFAVVLSGAAKTLLKKVGNGSTG